MVCSFAVMAQVGYSQDYVGPKEAVVILDQQISDLEGLSDYKTTNQNAVGLTSSSQTNSQTQMNLRVISKVQKFISKKGMSVAESVAEIEKNIQYMDASMAATFTQAVDNVKNLLSN